MKVIVSENDRQLGKRAAKLAAKYIREAIEEKGYARIILSTGASQFTTLDALVNENVDWTKVEMFHLDEYVNLPQNHPASFVRYLKERFVNKTGGLKAVHFVDTSMGAEWIIGKLTDELKVQQVDVGLIGIGENAHIAFNDPPADFENPASYIVVRLDADCRKQQLGEGWFPTLDDVPREAVSMTVSQILKCRHIISAVPYAVKASAVKKTLENDVNNQIPATVLKTHSSVTVFVDRDSASSVDREVLEQYL